MVSSAISELNTAEGVAKAMLLWRLRRGGYSSQINADATTLRVPIARFQPGA